MYGCLHLLRLIGAQIERFLVTGYFGKEAIVELKEKLSQSSHASPKPPFPRAKAPLLRGTGDSGDENFFALVVVPRLHLSPVCILNLLRF